LFVPTELVRYSRLLSAIELKLIVKSGELPLISTGKSGIALRYAGTTLVLIPPMMPFTIIPFL
jgi:hypothetical protein